MSITPDIDLTNNTDININVNLSLELFRISGTFSPIVGEDETFNQAVVDFEEKFDIASFPVFDKTFDVLLGSWGCEFTFSTPATAAKSVLVFQHLRVSDPTRCSLHPACSFAALHESREMAHRDEIGTPT